MCLSIVLDTGTGNHTTRPRLVLTSSITAAYRDTYFGKPTYAYPKKQSIRSKAKVPK